MEAVCADARFCHARPAAAGVIPAFARKRLRQMLSENNSAFERFKLNSTLIDFDNIPNDYTKRIMKAVDEKLSEKSFSGEFSLEECMVV